MITVEGTTLPGVMVITPQSYEDERGFFMETFNAIDFSEHGLPVNFVQDNHSRSKRGVLRGLHYQYPSWQGKLVRVLVGSVFDVVVDIRRRSSTFGQSFVIELSATNFKQLWVPPGYAHGFCGLTETSEVAYKCSTPYRPSDDAGVRWNDPDIGIAWPIRAPTLSKKYHELPFLAELEDLII